MPPTTSRDFQKAAAQRLEAAETLLRERHSLEAQYIGGYTFECTLKALILQYTPDAELPEQLKRITSGSAMHRSDVLVGELGKRNVSVPVDIIKRIRRANWTTDLRYEIGRRDTGETIAFLKSAKAVYNWVKGLLP
jgi:hypothetical protein